MSFHSLSHSSEEEKIICELCEKVILNEATPFTLTQPCEIPADIAANDYGITVPVKEFHPTTTALIYYCRPPPSLY